MPRRLPGRAIQAGTITVTQLETTVANTVQTGGGPKITAVTVTNASYNNLDDTAVDIAGGYIKITGTGFVTGCQVLINNTPATSTTFVSATEVRAQVPATAAGSYIVYLVNTDGGVAIRINGITFSATPTWVTGSTLTGNVDEAISIQLSATSATSYALAQGSTLPTGLTLTSGGLLSGTVTGLSNDTSYSFTINAIDAENQDSPRSFTITISANLQLARSLRFNPGDVTYLNRTAASGNRRIWTWSGWVKLTGISDYYVLFAAYANGQNTTRILINNDSKLHFLSFVNDAYTVQLITTQVFRDPGAWSHFVFALDTTQATAANRVRIYYNGSEITSFTTSTYPSQNLEPWINNANTHNIGSESTWGIFNGYMTDINFIDGQALTPTSFAKTNAETGQWIPKRYTGTYGTNGYYLNFSDNSNTTATTLGKDSSGNNNNWTLNNFSVAAGAGNDSLVDSPTSYGTDTGVGGEVRGNYCTLNPAIPPKNSGSASRTIANGGLDLSGASGGWTVAGGTFRIFSGSGRWYYETTGGVASNTVVGFHKLARGYFLDAIIGYTDGADTEGYGYGTDGNKLNNGASAYGASWTTTDVIGCAIDASGATTSITFYKNGVSQGVAFSNLTGDFIPAVSLGGSGPVVCNFGQRPFAYAAPIGFKAMNTHNLATPNVVKSNTAFDTVLYTGTGSARSITGYSFSPDLVWIKSRSSASWWHQLQDTVRGATKRLASNDSGVEATDATTLTAFNADGFSLGTSTSYNENASTYVAWAWDAGIDTVVNTAGSISANVRVNTTAGISIVSYTGTQATATVGHGLGVAPKLIIAKSRSVSGTNWVVYHSSLGSTSSLLILNLTNATTTITNYWGSAVPTSTVFGVANGVYDNNNGSMIAYCFAEVPGFSAFGSYTGNGSADGPFVYTGFRPRFILLKSSSVAATNWQINDTARDSYNVANKRLAPSATDAEATNFNFGDILSNGFKIRQTDQTWNSNGGTYIYAAFAESPFKYARAR